ncbi:hypothetical protein ACC706_38100, partial [Rhizobium johnstonii]
TSMAHLPCTLIERHTDATRFERSFSLMRAMGAAHSFIADNGPTAPTSMGAATWSRTASAMSSGSAGRQSDRASFWAWACA